MSFTRPTVTGWSSFYGETANAYQLLFNRSAFERRQSVELARQGNTATRATIRALTGVAPGGSVAATYSRVSAPSDLMSLGGLRTIDTFTAQSGVSTAADVVYINTNINDAVRAAPAYVVDASGNNGRP